MTYPPHEAAHIDQMQADARGAFDVMVLTYCELGASLGEQGAYVGIGNIIDQFPGNLTAYLAYAVKLLAELGWCQEHHCPASTCRAARHGRVDGYPAPAAPRPATPDKP